MVELDSLVTKSSMQTNTKNADANIGRSHKYLFRPPRAQLNHAPQIRTITTAEHSEIKETAPIKPNSSSAEYFTKTIATTISRTRNTSDETPAHFSGRSAGWDVVVGFKLCVSPILFEAICFFREESSRYRSRF